MQCGCPHFLLHRCPCTSALLSSWLAVASLPLQPWSALLIHLAHHLPLVAAVTIRQHRSPPMGLQSLWPPLPLPTLRVSVPLAPTFLLLRLSSAPPSSHPPGFSSSGPHFCSWG